MADQVSASPTANVNLLNGKTSSDPANGEMANENQRMSCTSKDPDLEEKRVSASEDESSTMKGATLNKSNKRNGEESFSDMQSSKKQKLATSGDTLASEPTIPGVPNAHQEVSDIFDNQSWAGFCEIESEPSYLSVILRRIGIEGVTVREVFMLDQESLMAQPSPIFGLVLLFRHREFDVVNQAKTCPANVWFANQMPGQNSCATLAMIHTILNIPDTAAVDIGEHMRQFKDFSRSLTPLQRGEAFAGWQFVKKVHNSFAKKMDILENDSYVAHKARKAALLVETANKPKDTKSRRRQREASTGSHESSDSFEGNAHHYLAFVPVGGTVYKLDGMDAQPTPMGEYDPSCPETWIYAFSDRLTALLESGGMDYGIFALAQSPLVSLRSQICETDNTRKKIDLRLSSIGSSWRSLISEDDVEPTSPGFLVGFTDERRAQHPVPPSVAAAIGGEEQPALLHRRAMLVVKFRRLVDEYMAEEAREMDEDTAAQARQWDYGPAIQRWLEMLAENGWLEANLEKYLPGKGK